MKAITVKEPFASLIVNGYKEYEFRSWKTKYRGKVLIHSSIKPSDRLHEFDIYDMDYSSGEIIGEAYIYDCKEVTDEFKKELIKKDKLVYKNACGYAFCLRDIKKYDNRISCKGHLSLWEFSDK